ncbi:MAG: hypothetical protein IT521_07025 [Burkholderiales bacterium]|nr:hypothetical protein [Burkholderiales bacterium]
MSTGEDLVRKGVDADKAGAVGAVQAAGLGLGVWLPVLGKTLAQRVVIGGAGFNAVQGAATRGASGAILEGTKAADEFKAFDPTAVTLDVLLGLAFGGIAHLSPAQRAQGEAAWSKIAEWTGTFKPSDIDALVTLKQAEHLNVESAPGRMASAEDIAKHHAAMKQAVDDLLNDRPVNVEALTEGAKFLPDAERIAFGKTIADELNAQAKGMVEADMLAQLARMEAEGKPGFIRSAEELLALKAATESPVLHPDLERAIEISRRPGFLRSAEEKLTLDAVLQGRAQDVIGLPDGMKAGTDAANESNSLKNSTSSPDTAPDPIRAAADQFVAERPDLTLTIGADQDGKPITISASKYLEDARLDTELAAQDAGLFEVAASCMLRG